jgi:hypothetical protein
MVNPFVPGAGKPPYHLIGRESELEDLEGGIRLAPNDPFSMTFVHGMRGVGKTVMLLEAGKLARQRTWEVIHVILSSNFGQDINDALDDLLDFHTPVPLRVLGKSSAAIAGTGGTIDLRKDRPRSFQNKVIQLLKTLGKHSGLLITVDEVRPGVANDALTRFGHDIQLLQGMGYRVALVMAGLSSSLTELLKQKDDFGAEQGITFLRRAEKLPIGSVAIPDVRTAFEQSLIESNRNTSVRTLTKMVEATGGYPFLVQLVGYWVWRSSDDYITDSQADRGIDKALRKLGALVHETALNDLSDVDKTFLLAMSKDDQPSKMEDIERRISAPSSQYVQKYKTRLVKANMIKRVDFGYVDFTMPWLREFLREEGAALGISDIIRSKRESRPLPDTLH